MGLFGFFQKRNFANGPISRDDYLSGKYDEVIQMMNFFSTLHDEYTPYNSKPLPWETYSKVGRTDPEIMAAKTAWQANVGADDSSTFAGSNLAKKRMYDLVYTQMQWSDFERKFVNLIAEEGNAITMHNDTGKPEVYSLSRFTVKWDKINNRAISYKMLDENGRPIPGMETLIHGVDLWHSRDPMFNNYPVAPSRIDVCWSIILLDNHAIIQNNRMFSRGAIGAILLGLKEGFDKIASKPIREGDKMTVREDLIERLKDMVSGYNKSHNIVSIPYLDQIFELGKSNKDLQFEQVLNMAAEKKARAFSVTMADLGKDLTYNNAATFSYAIYNKNRETS
jgi:hypothetical protein